MRSASPLPALEPHPYPADPAPARPSDRPALPPVIRESDATRINVLMNHAAVRPLVLMPGQNAIDLSAFVSDPRNVVLMTEDGRIGVACHQHEPGVFECHTAAHPDAHVPGCLAAVRSFIAFMFLSTDCMELLTRCPVNNRPAEALAIAVGGALDFERAAAWPTEHGPVAVRHYRLDYPQWVRTAEVLPRFGAWFHDRLQAENARLGIVEALHEHDPAHAAGVGKGLVSARSGQACELPAAGGR